VTSPPRSDRFGIVAAVLGGLVVALGAVLVIVLVLRDDGGTTTTAADTTLAPTTLALTSLGTIAPGPTTTAAATTTEAVTTTAAATTSTTTTTAPPFDGTLDDKTGEQQGTPAGRLVALRSAAHLGFTRLVFDFAPGGIPGYWIGYTGATTLGVILYPMSWSNPYDPGIFDAGGTSPVDVGDIVAVQDAGMGGGSGEWAFDILVTAQRPFRVGTLADPPRIYVDVGN